MRIEKVSARAKILTLLILGAILRIAVLEARSEHAMDNAPDEVEYVQIAKSVAAGDGFQINGKSTAYRDLLFPAAAGWLIKLSGSEQIVFYFQLVLSLGTGFLLYVLLRRRFSEVTSISVFGCWMIYPAAVMMPSLFMTETLFVFLWVLSLDLYDRMNESEYKLSFLILLGLTLGLLILTRAAGTLWLIAILLYLLLIRFETPLRLRFRTAILLFVFSMVMIMPWMFRNLRVVDGFVLNTNGGINLLIGNNPYATGGYFFSEDVQNLLPPESSGEIVRDRAAQDYALNYFFSNVKTSLELWPRKFAHFWSTDMALLAHYSPQQTGSLSEKLRQLPLWQLVLMSLPYAVLVMFGLAGFYLVKKFPARGLFILYVALSVLAAFASFGNPRFHFPVMPAMMIGAAAYIEKRPWDTAPKWRKLFLLLAVGMFGGIWLFEAAVVAGF